MKLTGHDIECLCAAKEKINENSSIHYTIKDIAQMVGMGSTKLKAAFKQYYGMGLYTYLFSQRMSKAKLSLETTDKPIKIIAKEAGFAYLSNFNVAFKKKFGKTPGEFRR